jgi:hypothetical protein
MVSVIGELNVLEPEGVTVRLTLRFPLSYLCVPLNVCFSRLVASPPELDPHAASATTVSAAPANANADLRALFR